MHKGHLRQPVHAVYTSDGLASSMLCYGNTAIVMSLVDKETRHWLMKAIPITLLIINLFIMGARNYNLSTLLSMYMNPCNRGVAC